MAFDVVRYAIIALAGVGVAFMTMTNYLAFRVLRPPKKLGFLWWHVTSISVAWLLVGAVALDRVIGRLGEPLSWRSYAMLLGTGLFAIAQVIIFGVERQRYVNRQVRRLAGRSRASDFEDLATDDPVNLAQARWSTPDAQLRRRTDDT